MKYNIGNIYYTLYNVHTWGYMNYVTVVSTRTLSYSTADRSRGKEKMHGKSGGTVNRGAR